MNTLESLRQKRSRLLEEINRLGEMRRGSVTEQYYTAQHQNGAQVRQGPYFLYSYKEQGRTISRRLPNARLAQRYREEIAAFRQFEALSGELVSVSQQICDFQAQAEAAAPAATPEKKRRSTSWRKSGGRSRG